MKPGRKLVWALFCLQMLCTLIAIAQNGDKPQVFQINGYIKDLGTFTFIKDVSTLSPSTLLHNRINMKIRPSAHFTIAAELRTRLLIGQNDFLIPGFAAAYTKDNGIVNLSFNLFNKSPLLINTMIDRLYIDYTDDKWTLRAGRQRVNWGVNLTWNPNDIFNSYNFLDFDYEERPGSDAVRLQYNFTPFSNLEAAFAPARSHDSIIGALKYIFNTHNYDIQFIGGNYCRDIVVGTGWAGSIKDVGFKGEFSYFQDWSDRKFQNIAVSASITADYTFKKGWYLIGSFLYNNIATNKIDPTAGLQAENLSPKLLMPAKYTFLVQLNKQFTPLWNGTFALIYSPVLNLFIISPVVSYNLAANWDLDFIVQSYYDNNASGKFDVLGNSFNLRLRWSFSN